MARRARIPAQLTKAPFTLIEARSAGVSKRALQGKAWRRLASGLYCWSELPDDTWHLLAAWQRRLPPDAVFIGLTAAWLYRLDVDPSHPVEVGVPSSSHARSRPGLVLRRLAGLDPKMVRGLRTVPAERMFVELRKHLSPMEYLVLADQALRLRLGRFDELADLAESPMETRLRWVLLQSGLPRPQVQARLPFGRADLYYPAARLVIEYDGVNHRDRIVDDNRRQNMRLNGGFRLLRFTAGDVYDRSDFLVSQVRTALIAREP